MKAGVSTNEMQEALARVERARQARTNAGRRLKRAEEAVRTAASDVSETEDEMKAAAAALDQAVRRGLTAAMKKGGTDMSVAMAELIARTLSAAQDGDSASGSDGGPAAEGGAAADGDGDGATPSGKPGDDAGAQTSLLDDAA